MSERLHVLIRGLVQGVGFRYSMRSEALRHGVTGWVRNLPNGCVEAEIEGDKEALDALLAWCRKGPMFAKVADVQTAARPSDGSQSGFTIR